jgi:hypothetical protein
VVLYGPFVVRLWSAVDGNGEGLPQLSPQAALGIDLYLNCSELGITHTPNLMKIFRLFFGDERFGPSVLVVFGF